MGTTNDLPLLQPFLTDGTQDTQGLHRGLGIENVVNDPLELEGVVGVGHQVWGICTGHVERVSKLLIILAVTEHLEKTIFVSNMFELVVGGAHSSSVDVFYHSRLRGAVEICTK